MSNDSRAAENVENDNVVFGLRKDTTSWLIFLIVCHANDRERSSQDGHV